MQRQRRGRGQSEMAEGEEQEVQPARGEKILCHAARLLPSPGPVNARSESISSRNMRRADEGRSLVPGCGVADRKLKIENCKLKIANCSAQPVRFQFSILRAPETFHSVS